MFHRKLWQVPEGIHWFIGRARYICSYWGKPPNITGSGHHISIYYGVTSSNHPTPFFRVPRIDDAYLVKLVSKRHFPQLKHQLPQWYHHFPEFNYHFPSKISAMSRVHDHLSKSNHHFWMHRHPFPRLRPSKLRLFGRGSGLERCLARSSVRKCGHTCWSIPRIVGSL